MMAEPTSPNSNESTESTTIPAGMTTETTTTTTHENTSPAPPPKPLSPHQQALATLQEAFPSVEPGVIEAILESQHGNTEASFEVLLGMSDPDYQAPATTDDHYALEQQEKEDALLAKRLAQQYDQQQQQQQQQQQRQQPQRQDSESVFSGFQEELPVIKERVIEAGNAAKKKIMGFYNSFMDQSSSSPDHQADSVTNDMRGLRLDSNPQMDDDAAFARRLAMEDAQLERLSAQRSKQQSEKKGVQVEEGDAVTFTTPDTKPAYIIHDDDDDDLDLYGATSDQVDEKREVTKGTDAKTEHKQD